MATRTLRAVVLFLTIVFLAGLSARGRPGVFVRPPADLDQIAAVIPLGNLNPAGGHVRPVNHMYLQYLSPQNGGADAIDVNAMAEGKVLMVIQRQTQACVLPDATLPGGCGATQMIDEYQIFIRHTGAVTMYVDHLHALDAGLGLPDWQDNTAGWIRVGPLSILCLGLNGARPPVRVHPGQRMGATRSYFFTWDIGIVDTEQVGGFLASGLLRYPSLHEMLQAMIDAGFASFPLDADQPFPGGQFTNAGRFIDYMIPPLAAAWSAKLVGDGSGGRVDWDVVDTLQGNWYRADVTDPTFNNILAIEANAVSFSPFNYDPANQTQVGLGQSFFDRILVSPPASIVAEARGRLSHGLLFTPDRVTAGTHHNPDPLAVQTGDYACYDIPDPEGGPPPHPLPARSLLVYLPLEAGVVHLKLRYVPITCTSLLTTLNPSTLATLAWWGDYVR